MNNCSFSRLITKKDNVFLQFTTAKLITIYANVLLQFVIAWLLQFSITVITIYDRYDNLRRLLLQFKIGITIHGIITIQDRNAKNSYIPYLYNTDTSVKRTLGSVPFNWCPY